jgi:hypothetical protein
MFPADIKDFAYLLNNDSHKVRRWFTPQLTDKKINTYEM